jgi:hypothetical protein
MGRQSHLVGRQHPAPLRRHNSGQSRSARRLALLELCVAASLWAIYAAGRSLAKSRSESAFENAAWIHNFEARLHLPSEAWLQGLIGSPDAFRVLNTYYVSAHFPISIAFLVLFFLYRPRVEYVWVRNQMAALTLAAMVVHIAFPAAPPRMFPQWGFVDAMKTYGPNAYGASSAHAANQMAAMPSLHVGWAALIAFVIWRAGPTWLRFTATAHAIITTAVVVLTANHWWLDGIAALVLLALAALIFPYPGPRQVRALHRARDTRLDDSWPSGPSDGLAPISQYSLEALQAAPLTAQPTVDEPKPSLR